MAIIHTYEHGNIGVRMITIECKASPSSVPAMRLGSVQTMEPVAEAVDTRNNTGDDGADSGEDLRSGQTDEGKHEAGSGSSDGLGVATNIQSCSKATDPTAPSASTEQPCRTAQAPKKAMMRRKKTKRAKKKANRPRTEAQDWNIHQLYEYSVQSPQADADFLEVAFGDRYRRSPRTIREDFCGTAVMACEWIKLHPDNKACGIDLDHDTLEYGKENHVSRLTHEQQSRLMLVEGDVLDGVPSSHPVPWSKTTAISNADDDAIRFDVIAAQNFSWMLFQDRRQLREYFKTCRDALHEEGCMVLDLHGGPDAQTVCLESTKHKDVGFTYWWEQASFDAITNVARCHIHFSFPDGTGHHKAFSYEWRLWSLPELRDVLLGAHFHKVQVYWELEEEEGDAFDGNFGEFVPAKSAPNDGSWIAYIVAYKS